MMREHELSCNTHSNNCDRLRVCQEKLYLGKLLLLWPYIANRNHLSYYIPWGHCEILEVKTFQWILRATGKCYKRCCLYHTKVQSRIVYSYVADIIVLWAKCLRCKTNWNQLENTMSCLSIATIDVSRMLIFLLTLYHCNSHPGLCVLKDAHILIHTPLTL